MWLLKRAQILLADLWACFRRGEKILPLRGIEQLTVFADYRLPQLLASLGIIRYHDPTVLELVPAGGELEVEIRAATIQAGHLLMQAMHLENAVYLDYLLWDLAKAAQSTHAAAFPAHCTRTIFY